MEKNMNMAWKLGFYDVDSVWGHNINCSLSSTESIFTFPFRSAAFFRFTTHHTVPWDPSSCPFTARGYIVHKQWSTTVLIGLQ